MIGTAAADLTRDSTRESDLGDIVTDAMRDATGAQIAFQNGGRHPGRYTAGSDNAGYGLYHSAVRR